MNTTLGLTPVTRLEFEQVPIDDLKYVYVVQCRRTAKVKIGVTDDPDRRIIELRRTSPTELWVIGTMPSRGFELETFLHSRFSEFRLHGEWFEGHPAMMDFLIPMLKSFDEHPEIIEARKEEK